MPGFEPESPPQGEVLTTILHTPGEAGYRSLYLSHAKRALYHLSYIPGYRTRAYTHNTYSLHTTHASPRSPPCIALITLPSVPSLHNPRLRNPYTSNHINYNALYGVLSHTVYRSLCIPLVGELYCRCRHADASPRYRQGGLRRNQLAPPTSQ